MILLLLFILSNFVLTHDANNNRVLINQSQVNELSISACLTLLQHCPDGIKQEIYNHCTEIFYSHLLKKHYVLGTFERQPYNDYRLIKDSSHAYNIEMKCYPPTGSWQIVYQDNRVPNSYLDVKSVTELNKNDYFMAGNAIVHVDKSKFQNKAADTFADRIFHIEENPLQLFNNAAIHPTENLLIAQSASRYDQFCNNTYHLYTWKDDMKNAALIHKLKTFKMKQIVDAILFAPNCTHIAIYLYHVPYYGKKDDFHYKMVAYNIETDECEFLGEIPNKNIHTYLKQKNLNEVPQTFEGIHMPKPTVADFNQFILTCLAYNWLSTAKKNLEVRREILAAFKNLASKERYRLVWKTTTPTHGNLFKKLHDYKSMAQ